MLEIFYEDKEIIVVKKPAGMESQARHSFEPDMVSGIRNHIREEAVQKSRRISPSAAEPYVGVIHRLDKPVAGIMVYAKTKEAAAALSAQIQENRVKKIYRAVVCGRCVDNVGNFVDYLLKDPKENLSKIVDKGTNGAKRAELKYRVLGTLEAEPPREALVPERENEAEATADKDRTRRKVPSWAGPGPLTLVEIELLTGRHHQIRAQFAGHGLPLWGDARYGAAGQRHMGQAGGPAARNSTAGIVRRAPRQTALCACGLTFIHPSTGERMTFAMKPEAAIFRLFEE